MKKLLFLLPLMMVGCNQPNPVAHDIPSIPLLWKLDIPVLHYPAFSNGLLISQEENSSFTQILGNVAVDTSTKQVLWRNPYKGTPAGDFRDITGNVSASFQGKLINYTYTKGLIVRDPRTNNILKTVFLPLDVDPQEVDPPPRYMFETVGDRLFFRINRYLFAYDMRDIINPALTTVTPLWRVNREPQGNLKQGITNISVDAESGRIAYGLMRLDEVAKISRSSIHVLDLNTGQQLWEQEVYRDNNSFTHNFVYVALAKGVAVASIDDYGYFFRGFDQATGIPKWTSEKFICPEGETTMMEFLVPNGDQFLAMPYGDHCFSSWNLYTGRKEWVFLAPKGHHVTFGQRPLVMNGVVYAANGPLWALDSKTGQVLGKSENVGAYQARATPTYDAPNHQILVWGDQLSAFRPIR